MLKLQKKAYSKGIKGILTLRANKTMVAISDFNSVFEVGFALSAIFVWIDLLPKIEKYFEKSLNFSETVLDNIIGRELASYALCFGWTSTVIFYANSIFKLKALSLLSAILSFSMLLIAGFAPELHCRDLWMVVILVFIFIPPMKVCWTILYSIPRYRYKRIEWNLRMLLKRQEDQDIKNKIDEAISNLKSVLRGTYIVKDKI